MLRYLLVVVALSFSVSDSRAEETTESAPGGQHQNKVIEVVDALGRHLQKLGRKYPELSNFQSKKAIEGTSLFYSYNFKLPNAKRAVREADFGEKGIYIRFICRPIPPPFQLAEAMAPPSLTLKRLNVYLWYKVEASTTVSPGLVEEVESLLDNYAKKLQKIDDNAS